jgi:hypothetical protein
MQKLFHQHKIYYPAQDSFKGVLDEVRKTITHLEDWFILMRFMSVQTKQVAWRLFPRLAFKRL